MNEIYMDYAAATPLAPEAMTAMRPFLEDYFLNPSARYDAARVTREALENARARVSAAIGARPAEIIWTSGGTEGDNLAVQGVLRAATENAPGHPAPPAAHNPDSPAAHWITDSIEHSAVLGAVEPLRRAGIDATVVPVNARGLVDPAAIAAAITDRTVLISVMLANGEIGTVQPVAEIARVVATTRADRAARGVRTPIYLHTDATAAVNYLDLNVARLGVDLMSFSSSKFYGPRGVGVLYARHDVALAPLFYGGGQERGRRAGTENVAGAVGLATAFETAQSRRADETRRLATLRDNAIRRLREAMPDIILNGDSKRRLPNNINLTVPGAEGVGLVLYLEKAGILAATGAACSSGDLEPSHVLTAIGRARDEAAQSLRLTLGRGTTPAHIDTLVAELPRVACRLREIHSGQ